MADPLDDVFKTDEERALALRKLKAEVAKLEADQKGKTGASADESVSAPPTQRTIVTRKPDGSIDERPNPNYVPPPKEPTVNVRSGKTVVGPEGQEMPEVTTKTVTQANYDRQAAQDLLAAANEATRLSLDEARNKIASDRYTAEQAMAEHNKRLDKIKLELEQQQQALSQRSQEISLRGQDVQAGIGQRGQDMGYEQSMAGEVSANQRALLPYWNAPGQVESTNSLMAGGPPVPTRPSPPPFDPQAVVMNAAMAARQQMPSQYVLPGAPAAVPLGKYTLPA